MKLRLPIGSLLNAATVAVGALIGLAIGHLMPEAMNQIVMQGLGIVVLGIGFKMLLGTENFLIIAASVAIGGILGMLVGIQSSIESFGMWAQTQFGGEEPGSFAEAVVATSLLFCVGPMTLLGCIEDAVEKKIDILALKSTLDGFGAIFFAAALGRGVLVTAVVVLVFQSALTLAAGPLRGIASHAAAMREMSAAGGMMMVGIGLSLTGLKSMPVANYLPALVIAPILVLAAERWKRR